MENKQYCVYKHVSPSGKVYIGQTCRKPEYRWNKGKGYKSHPHFYRAIEKYGWDNFEHVIIADGLTKKEADWLEKYLIAFYETMNPLKGYNHTKGGEGTTGYVKSAESRHKTSESMKGNKNGLGHVLSAESKRKMSESSKGKVMSDSARQKMSEAKKGNQYNLGRVLSDETKAKLRESAKLYWAKKKQQNLI